MYSRLKKKAFTHLSNAQAACELFMKNKWHSATVRSIGGRLIHTLNNGWELFCMIFFFTNATALSQYAFARRYKIFALSRDILVLHPRLRADKIQFNSIHSRRIRSATLYHPFHPPLHYRCSTRFRRRNKWTSIYDSIFEASQTHQWLPVCSIYARVVPIEIDFDKL